jgi:hypothetical protein
MGMDLERLNFHYDRLFKNECDDDEKDGFQKKDIRFVFIFFIVVLWTSILKEMLTPPKQKMFKNVSHYLIFRLSVGIIQSIYLYNMFLICRPWTGILLPVLLFTIIVFLNQMKLKK